MAGEILASAHLRWADTIAGGGGGGSSSYGLLCSDDDGRSGTGDSAGADDDDGETAIGSSVAIYAGRPGGGAGATSVAALGGASVAHDAPPRHDADSHTANSLRPVGSLSRWTASEGSTVSVPAGRSVRQVPGPLVGGEASNALLRQSTPPRTGVAAAASLASLPSPRSLSTASSALLLAHHDGARRRGNSTGSRRSLDDRLVDHGVESIAADLGAPTSSSDPAELRRIAAAASTQAAAETAATVAAAAAGRVIDADLISRRSSAGGDDDDDDDDAHCGGTEEDEHALHDSTEAAARGVASVVSSSAAPTPRVLTAAAATGAAAGLHGPFRRGLSVGAVRSESFDGSDDGSLRGPSVRASGGPATHGHASHLMLDALEETDADRESVLTPGTATGGGGDGCSIAEALVQDLARERDHGDADSVHAVAMLPTARSADATSTDAMGGVGRRRPPFAPAQRGLRSRGAVDARLMPPRAAVVPIAWGSGSGSAKASPTASTLRESGPQSMAADDGRSLGSGWSVSGSSVAPGRGGQSRRGMLRSSVASSVVTDVASGHAGAASVGGVHGSPRGPGSPDSFHAQAAAEDAQRAESRLSTSSRGSSASSSLLASLSALGAPAAPAAAAVFSGGASAASECGTSLRGVSRRRSSRHRQRHTAAATAASDQGGGVTEDEANGGASEHESQVVTAHGQDVAYAVRDRYGVDGAAGYDDEDEVGDILDDDEDAFFAGAGGGAGDIGGRFDDEDDDEDEDGDYADGGLETSEKGARSDRLIPPPRRHAAASASGGVAPAAPPPPWQSIIEAAARGAFPDVPSLLAALMRTSSDPPAAGRAIPAAAIAPPFDVAGGVADRPLLHSSRRIGAPAPTVDKGAAASAGVPQPDSARPPPPPSRSSPRVTAGTGAEAGVFRLSALELVRLSVAGAAETSADWWSSESVAASGGEGAASEPPPAQSQLAEGAEAGLADAAPTAAVPAEDSTAPEPASAAAADPPAADAAAPAPAPPPARRRAIERPGSAVPQRRQRQLQQQQRQAASGGEGHLAPPLPSLSVALPASPWLGPATPLVPPGGAPPRSPIARLGQQEWLELLQAEYPPPDDDEADAAVGALVEPRAYRPGGSARVQNPARLAARSAFAGAAPALGGGGSSAGLLGGFRRMWSASSAVAHRHRFTGGRGGGGGRGAGKRASPGLAAAGPSSAASAAAEAAGAAAEVDPLLMDYSVFFEAGDGDALPPLPWRRPRTAEARPAAAVAASSLEDHLRAAAAAGRRPVASSRLQRAKHGSSGGSD